MRALLSGLAVLALAVSGCLSTADLEPQDLNLALPVVVHRDGLPLDAPAAAQAMGGAVPRVVQKLLGTSGAEPNLGVTSSGAVFVSSGDFVMRSTDGGDTWEAVYEFGSLHPPVGVPFLGTDPVRNSDPMLWVDTATDRIFAPMMWPALACSQAAYSDDDGATWYDRPLGCNPAAPPFDHQKLATGPFVEDSPLAPFQRDYENVVYLCYNKLVATHCQLSADGGETFPFDVQVASSDGECGGINGHPTAAPNGTVFVPLGETCGEPYVAKSEDNGMTWRVVKLHVDGLGEAEADPEVAVTPNGMAYYSWRALTDHRLYVVRSADAFETLSRPFLVSPPDVTSTRFVGLSNGDDGRLAFAYLGTRDSAARPGEVNDETRWHLFTTFTLDAEADQPTFVTVQVTPEDDPVQIGYQWEGGGGDPARNLLDFIDSVIGPDGRFYVSFTDGCVEDCAGNATATKHQSRARNASLAVQLDGPVLRSPAAAEETRGNLAASPRSLRPEA